MKTAPFLLAGAAFVAPAYAQCGTPDALEDNDDCASAVAVPGGSATNLNVEDIDLDFYTVTVNPGEQVDVDVSFNGANGDVDLYLWDPTLACDSRVFGEDGGNGELDFSILGAGLEQVTWFNNGAAPADLVIEVRLWSGEVLTCNEYDITVTTGSAPPPCGAVDDAFENNDDCASASPIGDGVYAGLNVDIADPDFFTFVVADGATLDIVCDHVLANGDIDLYLWDPAVVCSTAVAGEGTTNGSLAQGWTSIAPETLNYTNTSGADQTLVLEVDIWDSSIETCNPDYTLVVTGASPTGPGPIGSQACPANANSTGVPAITTAFGETSVAANNVTLTSTDLPNGQFGLYVTSVTLVPAIPVNQGNLCLGGSVGRYQSNILQSDINGEFSLAIDLTATPTTAADVAVQPGETRFWQAWYRDGSASGPTSNFTSAVEITFQ